jgi:protein disulfide-isomerase A1
MKIGKFFKYTAVCILLTLCIMNVTCKDEDDVITLEDSNFDAELEKHQFLLIEFYAPWCGHCKALEPEYKKAAELLREENFGVRLAKVDATENSELTKRFAIQGYPTLKFYSNGQYSDYTGGRTSQDIIQWIKKKSGPPSTEINSVEEVEKFKANGNFVFLYFGSENSEKFKFFNTVASKYEYSFAHSFNEAVKSHYNAQDNIILFKNFDELRNDFDARLTEDAFEAFTDAYSIPIVGRFSERSVEVIFDKNKVGLFYIRSDESAADVAFDEVLRKIAPAYRNKIVFVFSDIKYDIEERLGEYFALTEKDLPHIRITDVVNEQEIKNYILEKKINEENLVQFIHDFLDNKLTPYFKSEPVPETQDEAVYKVVGKTFQDVVINTDKHVLIEFYAPWCGHCENFVPTYEEIAQVFNAESSNVVVAKMDATENEVDGLDISGYPTIQFYKAGDKSNPVNFKGTRGKWEVIDWVKKQIDPAYQKPIRNETAEEKTEEEQKEDL